MTGLSLPLFFLTKNNGAPAGDDDGCINPFSRFPSKYFLRYPTQDQIADKLIPKELAYFPQDQY